jgi:oligoendopeptidase F
MKDVPNEKKGGRHPMKISVDVECTPEEARSFLGLPDLSPIHDKYVQTVLESMQGNVSLDQMQNLIRSFSPMGEAGMKLFKQMMDIGLSGGSPSKGDS